MNGRAESKAGRKLQENSRLEGEIVAGIRLDSAGQNKMKTLEEAMMLLQKIHGIAEQYGMALSAIRRRRVDQDHRRQLPTLAASLKNQFGMISNR